MIIFDGFKLAKEREELLKQKVAALVSENKKIVIAAILFDEDKGSQLYSGLKKEMAERVGIDYRLFNFSLTDSTVAILEKINELNQDSEVTGIIIQKPWRKTWFKSVKQIESLSSLSEGRGEELKEEFVQWWSLLVSAIDQQKDVDGLHPSTLDSIRTNTWNQQGNQSNVLPATCKAVLTILEHASLIPKNQTSTEKIRPKKIIIIGKSDLLGKPLFYELRNRECEVEMIGSKELKHRIEQKKFLHDADIIVSSTGRVGLVNEEMVKEGVAIIDVGEPHGDVDFESVKEKASFITPVPGGVGPMTVVSLLENGVELAA